mmetsp:Transcript_19429/g.61111  ORF Transcript_19429/g.61111 Transcript_19429/m.61111 type:complete len:253 (-) Transcript_19429:191-949(-)
MRDAVLDRPVHLVLGRLLVLPQPLRVVALGGRHLQTVLLQDVHVESLLLLRRVLRLAHHIEDRAAVVLLAVAMHKQRNESNDDHGKYGHTGNGAVQNHGRRRRRTARAGALRTAVNAVGGDHLEGSQVRSLACRDAVHNDALHTRLDPRLRRLVVPLALGRNDHGRGAVARVRNHNLRGLRHTRDLKGFRLHHGRVNQLHFDRLRVAARGNGRPRLSRERRRLVHVGHNKDVLEITNDINKLVTVKGHRRAG